MSSLRAASDDSLEIVVVDNASDDDSAGVATRTDERAVIVARPTNDGYAAGCNAGVAALAGDTEYVVFANPDTVWPGGALEMLVGQLDGDTTIGLVSPLLVGADGDVQAIAEDDLTLRRTLLGMTRLAAPVRPRIPNNADVEWLHTAAAVVPMQVVRAIGGFDERFFLFAEDADFCRQIRGLGKRIVISSAVRVTHVGGASFEASHNAEETAGLRTRALAIYLEKYQGTLARRTFGAVGTIVYGLARHRGQAREAWRALTR